MIVPGFTFLSRRPPYYTPHLYIVISPIINGMVVFVNITTPKWGSDDTCILRIGDHDFITHDSIINYGDAKETKVDLLREAISKRYMTPQPPISADILKRIQEGAWKSKAFPESLLKYIPT